MFRRLFSFKLILCLLLVLSTCVIGQETEKSGSYTFTRTHAIKHTPVKNQSRTGTCWCFSTVSYLESEAIRLKGLNEDLSVMYIVRYTYPHKADNYIRLHGLANFGQGGQSHDVLDQIRRYGIVPESEYPGLNYGEKSHNHSEMVSMVKGILDGAVKQHQLTPRWKDAVDKVLDVYLGVPPEKIDFRGRTYTPREFARKVAGIIPDDYIELTSYSHHPFYKQCRLELPDNWTYNDEYYNVPINDFEAIVDYALKNGHSVVWDGDVSDRGFSSRNKGYAILPSEAKKEEASDEPDKDKPVTQAMRQETLDNYVTTDDHLMHIVGLAEDQNGDTYYYIKNSSGSERKFNGYLYMSEGYFRLNTTAVMIHKDALSKKMRKKLQIR